VKFNEIQSHCSPTLSVENLAEIQVQALSKRVFTISEWGALFNEISTGSLPNWIPQVHPDVQMHEQSRLTVQPFDIMSPHAGSGNLFDFQPTLSFDSSHSSIIDKNSNDLQLWKAQVVPSELMDHVDRVAATVKKIKSAWSKPFRDIEVGYNLVVTDLYMMNNNVKTVCSHFGDPTTAVQGQMVWEALEYLQGAYGD
jgi:hypothetical protein